MVIGRKYSFATKEDLQKEIDRQTFFLTQFEKDKKITKKRSIRCKVWMGVCAALGIGASLIPLLYVMIPVCVACLGGLVTAGIFNVKRTEEEFTVKKDYDDTRDYLNMLTDYGDTMVVTPEDLVTPNKAKKPVKQEYIEINRNENSKVEDLTK